MQNSRYVRENMTNVVGVDKLVKGSFIEHSTNMSVVQHMFDQISL